MLRLKKLQRKWNFIEIMVFKSDECVRAYLRELLTGLIISLNIKHEMTFYGFYQMDILKVLMSSIIKMFST